jgi:hypothetical protein
VLAHPSNKKHLTKGATDSGNFGGGHRNMRWLLPITCGVAVLLVGGCGWRDSDQLAAVETNRPEVAKEVPDQATLLLVSPRVLDFGTVERGERKQLSFAIQNPGATPIEVVEVATSCDCFHVDVAKRVIAPGEQIEATAGLDLSHDRRFVGCLRLDATGRNSDTARAFVIHAVVKVREPGGELPQR